VTVERSGAGDPERTLALLWRKPVEHTRGRKPSLTVDRIVNAAIAVADRDGIEAMSMARVAAETGVGTMTLYTYVPGKAELVDLMVDQVFQERRLEEVELDGWRDRIKLYARRTLEMHQRHPWLRQVSLAQPPFGPGLLAQEEFLLSSLERIGLPAREVTAGATAVMLFVDSAVGGIIRAHEIHPYATSASEHFWEKVFDPQRYPSMNSLWLGGGYDRGAAEAAAEALEFGLARLLDGIEHRA
jgi:AcrR family transcriptional regulator